MLEYLLILFVLNLSKCVTLQALVKNPSHNRAMVNRRRTVTVVEEMDTTWLKNIDEKRNQVGAIPDNNVALTKAKKEAYFQVNNRIICSCRNSNYANINLSALLFQHIYHTVGIEGNTMSLSQTRSIVETRMAIGGKSIAEHNEILGLDAALKYINTTLIDR